MIYLEFYFSFFDNHFNLSSVFVLEEEIYITSSKEAPRGFNHTMHQAKDYSGSYGSTTKPRFNRAAQIGNARWTPLL